MDTTTSIPALPQEHILTVRINGTVSLRLICTDDALQELLVGYLWNERQIDTPDELLRMELSPDHSRAEVQLDRDVQLSGGKVRPSGLGGEQLRVTDKLTSRALQNRYSIDTIRTYAAQLEEKTEKYRKTGGMHCSALFNGQRMLALYEDVGRHNTLDKLAGACLLHRIDAQDTLLITTGRISSDMIGKAAGIGVSVIVSFSTPTQRAFELADAAGLTLIGYLKTPQPRIYCGKARLK